MGSQGSMGRDEQWDYIYITVDGTSGHPMAGLLLGGAGWGFAPPRK